MFYRKIHADLNSVWSHRYPSYGSSGKDALIWPNRIRKMDRVPTVSYIYCSIRQTGQVDVDSKNSVVETADVSRRFSSGSTARVPTRLFYLKNFHHLTKGRSGGSSNTKKNRSRSRNKIIAAPFGYLKGHLRVETKEE